MKKVFVVFLFIFSTVSTFAQSEGESVKPIGGITLYRNVSLAAIEQNNYLDVIVKFKAAELGDYFTNGVKVVVVDNNTGKKIYRKRFSKSYLSWYWSAVCRFGFISCCGSSYPKVPNGSKGIPGRPNPGQPGNCPGKGLRISDMRTGPGAET